MSDWRSSWSRSDFIGRQIFVSSAYKAMFVSLSILRGKSLMNNANRIGPKIEPRGTPERTYFMEEQQFSMLKRDAGNENA